jgi:hypothetical protein
MGLVFDDDSEEAVACTTFLLLLVVVSNSVGGDRFDSLGGDRLTMRGSVSADDALVVRLHEAVAWL